MIIAAVTIQAAKSAPITHIAQRSILVAVVFFAIGLAFLGMRSAWVKKSRAFSNLPKPLRFANEESVIVVGPVEGRFSGTTTAGNWLDRVTVHDLGLPQSITVSVHDDGLHLRGSGDFALWIPREQIHGVRTSRGLAGDVVEPDGMIIVAWRLGYQDVDSGIRVSRHADHEQILAALVSLVASTSPAQNVSHSASSSNPNNTSQPNNTSHSTFTTNDGERSQA